MSDTVSRVEEQALAAMRGRLQRASIRHRTRLASLDLSMLDELADTVEVAGEPGCDPGEGTDDRLAAVADAGDTVKVVEERLVVGKCEVEQVPGTGTVTTTGTTRVTDATVTGGGTRRG